MKQFIFLMIILLACVAAPTFGQQVSGIVKDATGPVRDVSVVEKDLPSNGSITDNNGKFLFTLKGQSRILVVTAIGFMEQEVRLTGDPEKLEIYLQPDQQDLGQVVVVGYGVRKKITNSGSVSTINAAEIRNIPTANVQNTLQGRLPGFFSVQRSGQPGKDASDFFIRGISSINPDGNKPLIIVDDIEYTYEQLAQINVNEIEDISILKDASTTAIYGIKGANGVLIVRTRRGRGGKPQVNLRIESGMQSPTLRPKYLNAYETAYLVNEGLRNDGLNEQFTRQDLKLFYSGTDPYGHPDVDWYDAIFKRFSMQSNLNVDVSGGTDLVKYFISAGTFRQKGNLKHFTDPRNADMNNEYAFNRYNFRSNLDVQATRSLKLRLDVTGRFGRINEPFLVPFFTSRGSSGVLHDIMNFNVTRPYAAPFLNPDGSYAYAFGPGLTGEPTINARLATLGYNRTTRSDYNVLFDVQEKLDAITRGLSVNARIAYASSIDIARDMRRDQTPPAYHYDPATSSYTLDKMGLYTLSPFALRAGNNLFDKRVNLQASVNYDRIFNDHRFMTMLLFNQNTYTAKNYLQPVLNVPEKFRGYTWQFNYTFKNKYIVDFNAGYNGSDRFRSQNRFGFFPAAAAAWNLGEEKFFKDRFKDVQLFKLKLSYGLVGNDAVPENRYLYEQFYYRGDGYYFGEGGLPSTGIYEGSLGNSAVTWEKNKKFNSGIEINLLKNRLSLSVEYFRDYRYDQLFYPTVPLIMGVGVPRMNLVKVVNKGFDGYIRYQDKVNDLGYNLMFVFSHSKNKILFYDEPAPAYPWLAVTGQPIYQPFGYQQDGFYTNIQDIENSPRPNVPVSAIKPGDLKYKDLNGDHVIDEQDRGPIGKPNLPTTTGGLTLGLSYKGLDLSILFQGATGYSLALNGVGIEPFKGQMQPVHKLRWTPENAAGGMARFPRLGFNEGISSPASYLSDFWLIDARYLRLKTAELGYHLPGKMIPLGINSMRFYFTAYNLLTWTNYALYQQDPEVQGNSAGDSYLNQRVMNAGIQVGF